METPVEDKGEEAGAGREPSDHDAAPTPGKEAGEERRLDGKNPRLESSFKKDLARLMAVMELKESRFSQEWASTSSLRHPAAEERGFRHPSLPGRGSILGYSPL